MLEVLQSNSVSLESTTTKADHMYVGCEGERLQALELLLVAVIVHNQLLIAVQPCSIVC